MFFEYLFEKESGEMKLIQSAIRRGIVFFMCAALFLSVRASVAQTMLTQFAAGFGGDTEQNTGNSPKLQTDRQITIDGRMLEDDQLRSPANEDARKTSAEQQEQVPPPSEFQRFAASSVGRLLPVFGASFFSAAFPPATGAPVPADYVIGPEDEIFLLVWGQQDFYHKLTVDRNGEVFIPQVGSVSLAGMQYQQLEGHLRAQFGRIFKNFELSVSMGQLRSIQIYVAGNAVRTGVYTVSSLSTMVNALFASGGPLPHGSMRRVQLRRNGRLAAELDLYDLLLRGDKSGDARLQPEDVIYIPAVGPQIAIAGSVKNPAIYEIKDEKTVGGIMEMTGGFTPVANRARATIERVRGGVSRELVELSLNDTGMNAPVVDGDILQVLTIVPRFDDTVTLHGNVADPGRFAWRPGMRLRDIIPDKESLTTRDYWKKKNLLGNVPNEKYDLWSDTNAEKTATDNPLDEENTVPLLTRSYFVKRDLVATLTPEERMEIELKAEAAAKPGRILVEFAVADINWSYAVIERQNPMDLLTNLIPFNLGKLVLENDESQNLELRSGDIVTIFSQADIQVPQMQQTRMVKLQGEFNAPGIYTVSPNETLGQLVSKAGGFTPQAYPYGSEFTRVSTRRDQQARMESYIMDLEQEADAAARNRLTNAADSSEAATVSAEVESRKRTIARMRELRSTGRIVLNMRPDVNDISGIAGLTLEDGDVFTVPARPSVINVIGEVYNPNAFIHVDGRMAKEYMEFAGGPTRNADEKRVYIIRADGSVIPKQSVSGFDKLKLNPGDSLVVPEHLFKTTFLRELRNWSQVFSQFGLGIAAVNVLR